MAAEKAAAAAVRAELEGQESARIAAALGRAEARQSLAARQQQLVDGCARDAEQILAWVAQTRAARSRPKVDEVNFAADAANVGREIGELVTRNLAALDPGPLARQLGRSRRQLDDDVERTAAQLQQRLGGLEVDARAWGGRLSQELDREAAWAAAEATREAEHQAACRRVLAEMASGAERAHAADVPVERVAVGPAVEAAVARARDEAEQVASHVAAELARSGQSFEAAVARLAELGASLVERAEEAGRAAAEQTEKAADDAVGTVAAAFEGVQKGFRAVPRTGATPEKAPPYQKRMPVDPVSPRGILVEIYPRP